MKASWNRPASPDDDGPFRIWTEYNYYQGTLPRVIDGYETDEEGEIVEYETYEEAQAVLDDYYHGDSGYDGIPPANILSHGQAGAHKKVIVQAGGKL